MDLAWHGYDGISSTATIRVLHDPAVLMSPGWTAASWPKPAGCGYSVDVTKGGTGSYTSIQAAINALTITLNTPTCVVIRDTETYSEQVTVQGFANNGYRLKIMADPTFVSSAPAVNPPMLSTAAFQIMNDSVTVQGINVISTNTVAYGILASSASVNISSVNVISGEKILTAGIAVSSYSTVSYSSITVQSANGLKITGSNSEVSFSTITNNTVAYSALLIFNNSDSNIVTHSYISNPSGTGVSLVTGADYNTISDSTMTSNGTTAGNYALYILNSATNTIADSYIQGSTAAYISGSTGTILNSSVFVATNTTGVALWFAGGNVNLALSSSTFSGGSQGAGIYLDENNSGVINLSSNTISGGKFGVNIATQSAGTTLSIASMTFQSLTAGATAINFLGGQFVLTFPKVAFNSANITVNVNGSSLASGSRITMRQFAGPRSGPAYENDPVGYVDWPIASAKSGPWSDPDTWDSGTVPTSANAVTIAAGHTITIDIMTAVSSTTTINGILQASREVSSNWTLTGGDINVNAGGTLDYGNEGNTIPTTINAQLVLASGTYAGQYGLIINNGGNFTVRGSTKTPYAFASASIGATDTNLKVYGSTSTDGWQAGDVITIGPTNGNGVATTSSRIITSVDHTGGSNTVSWSVAEPLDTARTLSSTSPIIVGNLTRNVLVQSSGTDVNSNSAYIRNLAQNATSFSLTLGEFAYLGTNAAGKYGITFNDSLTHGSISSSTVRNGYDGIFLNASSTNILTGNNLYANSIGIWLAGSSSNTLTGNNSYSNTAVGIYLNGSFNNTLTGNNSYSNLTSIGGGIYLYGSNNNTLTGNNSYCNAISAGGGIYLYGSNNILTGNNSYSNSSDGIYFESASSSNTLTGNNFYSNSYGIYLSGSNNNTLTRNNSYSNSQPGIYLASSNNTLTGNNFYSNSSYGIWLWNASNNTLTGNNIYSNSYGIRAGNSSGNTVVGGNIGYSAAGDSLNNTTAEIFFEPGGTAETMVLKGVRINPLAGVSADGMDVDGASLISYNQDFDTGTVHIWGNYRLAGSTLTLDYTSRLYVSTNTAPKLMRGVGHSITAVATDDAATLSELITVKHTGGNSWTVTGSSSGVLGTFTQSISGYHDFADSSKVHFRLTVGGTLNVDDMLDFVTVAASNDVNRQKKLLFGPAASSFNNGRSKLEVDLAGGIVLRGTTDGSFPTIVDWLSSASTYYTFVDSGAFTAVYSTFTNMDPAGIQLSGNKGVAISSSAFDLAGQGTSSTGAYITVRDLTSAATFYGLTFNNTRPNTQLYNVYVEGNNPSLNWVMRNWQGANAGGTNDYDPGNKVKWLPAEPIAAQPAFSAVFVSSITARWNAAGNEPGTIYNLEASSGVFPNYYTGNKSSATYATQAVVENMESNTTYYFRVNAVMASTSAYADLGSTSTLANQVTGGQFQNIYYSSVTVNWLSFPASPSSSACEGYMVQASTASDFSGVLASSNTLSPVLSTLTVSGLSSGTTYYFRVGSLNWGGAANYVNTGSTQTKWGMVNNITGTPLSPGAITWSWDSLPEARAYNVYQTSDMASPVSQSVNSFTQTGLSTNTAYGVIVAMVDEVGQEGPLSDAVTSYTLVETPTKIYFDEVSSNAITAAAYAATPAFTGLDSGLSGVNISTSGTYAQPWRNGDKWVTKARMPTARGAFAAGTIGGKLYAVGGSSDGSNFLNTNEEYDPASNTWIAKAVMPTARVQLGAGIIGGKLYAVGGWNGTNLNTNEEYDPAGNTWSTKAVMSTARWDLSVGVIGGKLYVVGGWNNSSFFNTNEEYDPAANTWVIKTAMPTARDVFAVGVIGGKLYAVGGWNGAHLNTNEEYDPAANTWATKKVMPTARRFLAAGVIGGKLYAVGGDINWVNLNINEEYDPGSNTWVTKVVMPTVRHNFSVGVIGGKLYAVGGEYLNTNEEYDSGVASTFTALMPNTQYFFKAKARNALGVETGDITLSTYTLAAVPGAATPAYPTVSSNSVTVNWTQSTNPTGVTLYRAQASTDSAFGLVAASSDTYNLNAVFPGLSPNTTYYARVAAISLNGIITDYKALGSTITWVETPTRIYFDEVSSTAITAAAYAANPAFTGLDVGLSGVAVAINNVYKPWQNGNKWTMKTGMSAARHGLAGGAIGGKLYVVGGLNVTGYLNTNEEYDPVANTWLPKAAMPTPREILTAGVIGGKLYMVGGNNGTPMNTNEEYDPAANTWSTKAVMPTARKFLTAGVINGKLYVVGGTNGSWLNTNEEYDPAANTWATKAAMPTARGTFASGVISGKLYAVGGTNGSANLNKNEEYDPPNDTWVTKAAMPTVRDDLSAGVIGGKLYAVGGNNGSLLNTNEEYDPVSGTWITKAVMSTARNYLFASAAGGRLYVLGGNDGVNDLNNNEEYDPGVASSFTALTPNTQYFFKAKARNALGAETAELVGFSTYTLAAVPGAATPVFTGVSSRAVTVNWTQSDNPVGTIYNLQISTALDFSVINSSGQVSGIQYPVTGLYPNTTYYARVAAINHDGLITDYKALGSTMTWVETPTSIYFDEITTNSITASGYAATPAFTGLDVGLSGVAVAINDAYKPWRNGNKWTTKAVIPTPRNKLSIGVIGGKLYAVGGGVGGSYFNTNEEYDPASNTWSTKAVMPTARRGLSVGVIGPKLYAVGGQDSSGYLNANEEYDPASNTWATKTVMPTSRGALSMGVISGKLYAIGGIGGSENENEEYNPATNTWVTKAVMLTARAELSAGVIDGKLYAVGGSGGSLNEEYDPVSNTWVTKAAMPTIRTGLSAGVIGGKLYAIGGSSVTGICLTTNEEYDPAANTWNTKTAMPTARYMMSGAVIGGKLYTVGGDNGSSYLNVNEEYDPGVASSFTALTPNTQYFFKAKARNALGAETGEITLSTYTLAAIPSTATPSFTGVSSRAVTVNWTQSANPDGTMYYAQLSTASDFSAISGSSTTSNYQLTTSNLLPNTTYYARVAAINHDGLITDYKTLGSTMTWVEPPTSIYFDEVSSNSITASGYAATPAFTGLDVGLSGVTVAMNNAYQPWRNGNKWTVKAGMPTQRDGVSGGVIGGKLYAVGGSNGLGVLNINEEYDPVANTWVTKTVMSTARMWLSAGVIDGKLYAMGGSPDGSSPLNINEEYDPASNTWVTKAVIPTARYTFSVGALGNKLYAVGGSPDGGSSLNTNEEYDPAANTWRIRAVMPTSRNGLSVGVIGGKLYVVGGWSGGAPSFNTNEEYDPVFNTWAAKAAMPTARTGLSAGVIGGKLYAVGGTFNGSSFFTANEEYDPASNTWTTKAVMTTARCNFFLGVKSGKLYALGGFNSSYSNANEEYDPGVASTFTALTPNTLYNFKTKARNALGVETGEVTLSTYTLAAVPGAATPAFTGVSSNAVTVNWTQSANPSAVTLYRAQASTDSAFGLVMASSDTYNLNAVLPGLLPNTTYYGRVAAISINGIITAYKALGSTMTWVETPTSIYFTEISSNSITASGYAATPAFSGLDAGLSGVAVAINNAYKPWRNGNMWATKALMPTDRGQLSTGVIGGKLYAVGGWNGANYLNTNEEYDPVSNTWATKAVMPTARDGLSAGVIGGKLYAVGGTPHNNDNPFNTNEEYDPASNTWTTKAAMPTAREFLSAGVIGGKLYAVGGEIGSGWLNTDEEYDPASNTWATKTVMPTARRFLSAGVISGKLYVVGGWNGSYLHTNEEYDPVADTWSTKAAMPTAREGFFTGIVGGKLYALGGNVPNLNTNEEYDPAADTWSIKAVIPALRGFGSAEIIGGKLYVVGGDSGAGTLHTNEEYDPGVASSFTALTPNMLYSFKAKARNALGVETGEITVSTYTLAAVALPHTGTPLFASIATSTIMVNWSSGSVTGGFNGSGASYKIQVSSLSDFSVITSSSLVSSIQYPVSGLSADTTYFFRARAYNTAGVTDYSWLELGSTSTLAEQVTGVQLTSVILSSATMIWNTVTGQGYAVEASTASDFSGVILSSLTLQPSAFSLSVGSLFPNTTYFFHAGALNWNGTGNFASAIASSTLANQVTGQQLHLFISSVAVSWAALPLTPSSASCEGFIVDASTVSDFSGLVFSSFTLQPSAFSLSVANLDSDVEYYFRVGSLGWANIPNYTFAGSTVTPDIIPPGISTGVAAYQSGAANSVKLFWTAPGNNGYLKNLAMGSEFRIQWSTNPPETVIWSTANVQAIMPTDFVNAGVTVSALINNLPAEKTAYFRVWVADEKQNWSVQSDTVSASVSPFDFAIVNSAGNAGRHTSLALDGLGNTHISYYSPGDTSLRYAKGNGTSWAVQAVDNAGDAVTSLALDGSGNPHISYYDGANKKLKYASWTGTSWSIETVDSAGDVGEYASLALDGVGNPRISYFDNTNQDLKYAKWTGASWSTQTVDSAGDVGEYTSLALDGAGNPRISYFNNTNQDLKYAKWTGASWDVETVDGAGGNVGEYTSLALDGAGNPHISYYDGYNGGLKYTKRTGASWDIQTVDNAGAAGTYTSLALDGAGNPYISYSAAAAGDLKFARWTGTSWSTQTVDSEGDVGSYTSLALDGAGSPGISYYGVTNGGLKTAKWTGAEFTIPMGGNARGKVQAPDNMHTGLLGSTSIQWLWTDHAANEAGFRVYYSSYGSANDDFTLAAGTATLLTDAANWFQTGLTPNTSYQAYAAAVNDGGAVVSSAAVIYTWAAQPQNSRFAGVYISSAALAWNFGTNNPSWTNYEAEVSSEPGFSAPASSYSDTGNAFLAAGLVSNATYYLRVKAVSAQGISTAYTAAVSTITNPAAPAAVSVSSVTYSSFTVNWNSNGNSPYTRYIVQAAADPGFTVSFMSTVTYLNQYAFEGLSANTTYFTRLRAKGLTGVETAFVEFGSTVTTTLYPSYAPLSSVTATSVRANWGKNSNADGTLYLAQVSTDNFGSVLASSKTADNNLVFSMLTPNTTHYFRAASINAVGSLSLYISLGSTITYAAPALQHINTFPAVGGFTVLFQWLANGNPAYTEYFAQVSTAADFSGDAKFPARWFTGVSTQAAHLTPFTGYYFRVKARNISGTETGYLNLGSTTTFTDVDISSPVITNNQTGDNTWRGSNNGVYDVDFADYGGSFLQQVEVKAMTGMAQTGTLVSDWAPVLTNINSAAYTADFSLSPAVFGLLAQGTNYISVRAIDGAGNHTDLTDAFYVIKDSAAPVIADNQAGDNIWRQTDPGPIYNVDFADSDSGLEGIEYSASDNPNSADADVLDWTRIAALSAGQNSYTADWGVNFAGLLNVVTNYISVRARDRAGNEATAVDAFKVLKNINGPEVKITAPASGYRSALAAVSGTAAQVLAYPITGVELKILDKSAMLYWNGFDFSSPAPLWFNASGTAVWNYDTSAVAWLNGVSYEAVVRSSDTTGNYSAPYATATFTFDASVPSAGVTWPQNGVAVSSLNYITGTALDAPPNSGIASVALRFGRASDGKWWNFFGRNWSDMAVSTLAAGGASWHYQPDCYLKSNLASNASYYLTAAPGDWATPSNSPLFGVYGTTFTFLDVSSPSAVSVISASSGTLPGRIQLQWAAAGDDGDDGIMLYGQFAVQYSTWAGAEFSTRTAQVMVSTMNITPGSTQYLTISGLVPSVTYYLTLWTMDDAELWSDASPAVSEISGAYLTDQISGYVKNPAAQGITGVLVEAINGFGSTSGNAYTIDDGSGTFVVSGLADGFYRIQVTWTENGFVSSVSKDLIPMGYADADFELSVAYQLASVSGQVAAYTKAEGLRLKAKGRSKVEGAGVYVELYQGGRKIATADVGDDGRFKIANLLPGKYTVKIVGLPEGSKEVKVQLKEGQNLEISPLGTLLKKDKVYAYPNPASKSVIFHIESDRPALKKHIIVFEVDGRVIREFADADAGWNTSGAYVYEFTWNIDPKVASGIYIYMVKVKDEGTGDTEKTIKKLAIVR
ncbi:MAG: fibronectin type III domain-containing protein [Elusimicrobia bacterium]|nr:fibronectin type III domain-containing protein [Elusimicrobiota bacterium]